MCSNVLWLGPVSRRLPRDAIRQNLNRQVEKPYLGAEGRGGEQAEANDQSINKTMMNSIRPDALASLLMQPAEEDE
jgi:hypothetical protein